MWVHTDKNGGKDGSYSPLEKQSDPLQQDLYKDKHPFDSVIPERVLFREEQSGTPHKCPVMG